MDVKGKLKIGQQKCESTVLMAAEQSRRRAAAKAPVGAQIKRVIDLLFQTRKALTPDQINEACYVDLKANKVVSDSLKNNLKVDYDGKLFSYKPKHDVKDKIGLLNLIDTCSDGISVDDLKDAYPNAMEDLQSLKAEGQITLLSNSHSREYIAYSLNSRGINLNVDDDLKLLFRSIDLPSEIATKTVERRVATKTKSMAPKSKPKKRKLDITKLTNAHLPELFSDF